MKYLSKLKKKSKLLSLFLVLILGFNNLEAQTTTIVASFCGSTLPAIGSNISAVKYSGATKYRFKVINNTTLAEQTLDRTERYFNFTQFPTYSYNTTYTVSVALEIGGVFKPYGPTCNITTPSVSAKILPEYCETILPEIGTNISCNSVWGATKYRFRIYDGTTQTIDKTVRYFNLTQFPSYAYNTTYIVDVAVEIDGVFTPYGSACSVTSPELSPIIDPVFCGTELASIGTTVSAKSVFGATQYKFRINDGTLSQELIKDTRSFTFTQFPTYSYGTTYSVEVAAFVNDAWSTYGPVCSISTPIPTTNIVSNWCDATIQNFYLDTISAIPFNGATSYTFTIFKDGLEQESITKSYPFLRAFEFSSLEYNTNYQIAVKIEIDGKTGDYGDTCNINTTEYPYTFMIPSQCNSTISSITTPLYCYSVWEAEEYKIRLVSTNGTEYLTSTTRAFGLHWLNTQQFNTTYTIDFSIKYQGEYKPYGSACTITTPQLMSKLRSDFCGTTIASDSNYFYCDKVLGLISGAYKFRIFDGTSYFEVERPTYTCNFNLFTSLVKTPGKTYSVDVAVRHNGVWGEWGPACNITLPATKSETLAIDNSNESSEFMVNVAPNPFNTTFRINLSDDQLSSDKIDVVLYNSTGQIIERYSSNSAAISSLNIGETCAKGIYILKVVTGNKISINKLIKE
jgi:hypothetical protein